MGRFGWELSNLAVDATGIGMYLCLVEASELLRMNRGRRKKYLRRQNLRSEGINGKDITLKREVFEKCNVLGTKATSYLQSIVPEHVKNA
jgi:hypothetical protein